MDFPRARAIEDRDAADAKPKGEMHRQAVSADQQAMIGDVAEMLEKRRPLGQHVDNESLGRQRSLQILIVGPVLHGPGGSSDQRHGDVAVQARRDRRGQAVTLTGELPPQTFENQVLVTSAIPQLEFIRAFAAETTDQTEVKPSVGVLRIAMLPEPSA